MALTVPVEATGQGLPSADELADMDDFSALDEAAAKRAREARRAEEEQAQKERAERARREQEIRERERQNQPQYQAPGAAAMQAGSMPNLDGTPVPEPADETAAAADEGGRYYARTLNLEGGLGFHHIGSARAGVPMSFGLGFLGEVYSGSDAVRHNDQNDTLVGNLLVQGTFSEYFSANFRVQARNSINSFGRPQAMLSLGDMTFGLRGHLPVQPWLDLAADATFYVPTGFGSAGPAFSATSVRPRLLATVDFGELVGPIAGADGSSHRLALDGHINIGYRFDNSENLVADGLELTRIERFAYGISAYDLLEIGVGVQYDFAYASPYLSWNLGIPLAGVDALCQGDRPLKCVDQLGFAAYPQTLSLGVRGEPVKNLGLHAGIDIGLTSADAYGLPVTLPVNFLIGASWTIDPRGTRIEERVVETVVEKEPVYGHLLGLVLDEASGEPVGGARVEYVGREESIQVASQTTGLFRSYNFAPETALDLQVTHPDYEAATVSHVVADGEQRIEIKLRALPRNGIVRGAVNDATGQPIPNASVKLAGKKGFETQSSPDGSFSFDVEPGSYSLTASAPGHQTSGRDILLESRGELKFDLVLRPAAAENRVEVSAEEIRIQDRIQFESGAATILPESFGILDQVVAVVFENPQIKRLEIGGHTDDIGSADANLELSQKRAEAVRNYLMEKGISGDRLSAKGYGSEVPLLPNTSNRNRSLNRRVEFRIVD